MCLAKVQKTIVWVRTTSLFVRLIRNSIENLVKKKLFSKLSLKSFWFFLYCTLIIQLARVLFSIIDYFTCCGLQEFTIIKKPPMIGGFFTKNTTMLYFIL